jgi:hypothetical protein
MYSITVITYVADCTVSVRDIGDNCDRVQVSLILVILIQNRIRDIGDNCDRVQVSLILVILIQ